MKESINRALLPTWLLGMAIAIASFVFLLVYRLVDPAASIEPLVWLVLGLMCQTGGFVGMRFFPQQAFWPGLCLLVAAPFTVWAGIVGPGTLFGFSYSIVVEILNGYVQPLLYYTALPMMLTALVVGVLFGALGAVALVDDILQLSNRLGKAKGGSKAPAAPAEEPKQPQPTPSLDKTAEIAPS